MELHTLPFVVVDVETTGGQPDGADRVTEVAAVHVDGAQVALAFHSLVNPGRPIPWHIQRLTGIDDDMVRDAPRFRDIAGEFAAHLAGRVFVAHNARFDWGFLTAEMRRARGLGLSGSMLCTVRLTRMLLPALESRGLDSVAQYFGVENPARHRAGGDALVTAQVLERLLLLAREKGARTLADLESICRRRTRLQSRRARQRARKRRRGLIDPDQPGLDQAPRNPRLH